MGEMEILSKTELRQLVGASSGDGGCGTSKDTCKPTPECYTGENNGVCTWVALLHHCPHFRIACFCGDEGEMDEKEKNLILQ